MALNVNMNIATPLWRILNHSFIVFKLCASFPLEESSGG